MNSDFNHGGLQAALHAWTALLGSDRVLIDLDALLRYQQCTETRQRTLPAALVAQSAREVADIVRIAARFQVPLYPISTGHNWGYGCANPATAGSVVVDLSRMNRIVDFDPELGLVTLEPGVTQQQLADYLDQHGHCFMVPTTGAGPSCSILGNALERGYGITPIADHFAAVTSLEAVLPDARFYRSAMAELGATTVNRAFKWGIGPYLDGLFAQGNFGIVTQMTIALARIPKGFSAFYFGAENDSSLEALVMATRNIMTNLSGIVGSVNLMNRHRVLAMTTQYPSELATPEGTLPKSVIARLGREHQVMAWTGAGALYGEPSVIQAAKKIARKFLAPASDRLIFMTPHKVGWVRRGARFIRGATGERLRNTITVLEASLKIMLGRPDELALRLAYWKTGGAATDRGALDPAQDGCGLIWYPPLVPMRRSDVREYVSHITETCADHGIEPLITLTALSDRCFDSSVPLMFEKTSATQVRAAERCYQALFEKGLEKGYLPYRLNPQSMRWVADGGSEYWNTVAKLKAAIDPGGIIAPGRYSPAHASDQK